jgi:hypothetical protein
VTNAVDAYLTAGTLPAPGLRCTGDVQPFTKPLQSAEPRSLSAGGTGTNQAPVFVPPIPSILLGTR